VRLRLPDPVRDVIETTVSQVVGLIDAPDPDDPAVGRLLPDAYRDDTEAAREFRELTQDDLLERKRSDAAVVLATVRGRDLDVAQAEAWLRSLTDVRLVLGERLGLRADGDAEVLMGHGDDDVRQAVAVLQHLGWVQELLIEALEGGGH